MIKKDNYGILNITKRNTIEYFKKARLWGVLEQTIYILRSLLVVAELMILERLFDNVLDINDDSYKLIVTFLIVLLIILVTEQILGGASSYLFSKVSYSNMGKFMVSFQRKLSKIDAVNFENTKFLDDVDKAKECLEYESLGHYSSLTLQLFTYHLVFFIAVGGYLFLLAPILPIIILLSFVPAIISQILQVSSYSKLESDNALLRRKYKYYKKALVDRTYYKETRMLGAFPFFYNKFVKNLNLASFNKWRMELRANKILFVANTVSFIGLALAIVVLVYLTMTAKISVGAFASVLLVLTQIFNIVDEVVSVHFNQGKENISQIINFYKLMDMEEVENKSNSNVNFQKGIEVRDVYFHYPESDKNIFNGINLTINAGEQIALVGANGSGKSTLVRLLTGLYTPNKGDVEVFGLNTKEFREEIYNNVSAVFQNFQKYKMTLKNNVIISEYSKKICLADIEKIMEQFELAKYKNKLETMLSPEFGGIDLSGGLWQRIAIARGFYRTSKIMIFDEPTSAIDPLEEDEIYKLLNKLSLGKTTLIVTHRLGVAKYVDKIIVLDKGQIVEIGNHELLVKKDGYYSKMWNAQAKWYNK